MFTVAFAVVTAACKSTSEEATGPLTTPFYGFNSKSAKQDSKFGKTENAEIGSALGHMSKMEESSAKVFETKNPKRLFTNSFFSYIDGDRFQMVQSAESRSTRSSGRKKGSKIHRINSKNSLKKEQISGESENSCNDISDGKKAVIFISRGTTDGNGGQTMKDHEINRLEIFNSNNDSKSPYLSKWNNKEQSSGLINKHNVSPRNISTGIHYNNKNRILYPFITNAGPVNSAPYSDIPFIRSANNGSISKSNRNVKLTALGVGNKFEGSSSAQNRFRKGNVYNRFISPRDGNYKSSSSNNRTNWFNFAALHGMSPLNVVNNGFRYPSRGNVYTGFANANDSDSGINSFNIANKKYGSPNKGNVYTGFANDSDGGINSFKLGDKSSSSNISYSEHGSPSKGDVYAGFANSNKIIGELNSSYLGYNESNLSNYSPAENRPSNIGNVFVGSTDANIATDWSISSNLGNTGISISNISNYGLSSFNKLLGNTELESANKGNVYAGFTISTNGNTGLKNTNKGDNGLNSFDISNNVTSFESKPDTQYIPSAGGNVYVGFINTSKEFGSSFSNMGNLGLISSSVDQNGQGSFSSSNAGNKGLGSSTLSNNGLGSSTSFVDNSWPAISSSDKGSAGLGSSNSSSSSPNVNKISINSDKNSESDNQTSIDENKGDNNLLNFWVGHNYTNNVNHGYNNIHENNAVQLPSQVHDGNHQNNVNSNSQAVPSKDHPVLSEVPETGFQCGDQAVSGYYADTASEAGCQVFHICQLRGNGLVQQDSFLCPNGTIFNQKYFVCDWWFNFDCSTAESFYSLNEQIGTSKNSIRNGGSVDTLRSNSDIYNRRSSKSTKPNNRGGRRNLSSNRSSGIITKERNRVRSGYENNLSAKQLNIWRNLYMDSLETKRELLTNPRFL